MSTKKPVDEWKSSLVPVLDSKVNELHIMGYSRTTREDVWKCLSKKVWKGNPEKRLHEVVEDILHLSSSLYMSYLTVEAYQDEEGLLASIAALTQPNQ
ncbi:post-transcriptional regulator [Radiobacillus kanasensis]|uniref:post-transcriptional regulator n=1 Tax=Radiobacillus kanasensis TaxID=2844358 RepID=UPI001E31D22F|nr:post-transcriptional regulator [Radiobacillus kanasensis]UFT97889.1 post-transcriptional regulator [Radiobacillus kanasensis]